MWRSMPRSARTRQGARRALAEQEFEPAKAAARSPIAKSMLPRITVVTPSYNHAAVLEECIVSVLEQGYPNLQYIVVDGGSTDGSIDVLRRYEDSFDWWTSEPDDGQTDALNKGFRRATGELVCWLNSDDFFYPGALAAAGEAYLADPDAPFYFGNGYRVDRAGCKIAEFFPDGNVQFRREAITFGLNCILQPSTFIRRNALEMVGLLDDTLHYGFDSNLWIELAALGRPRPIRGHLSASREYGETKTSTGSFARAEELRRIAERHAGVAATPGSISYYLDTLHRLASSRADVFPPEYLRAIEAFWSDTSQLLTRYGARPDGFPVPLPADLVTAHPIPKPKAGRTRVGIELRQVTRGASGGIVVVLVGTLQALFRQRPDIDFVVFSTVFNRELLTADAPNVEVITLPLNGFFAELGRMAHEREVDVLIRSYPTVEEVDFPLKQQIFLLPDVQHEYYPEFFDAISLNTRRRAFRTPLRGAGAIMTISEYARETIEEHAEGERDVFVASPSLPPDFLAARSEDATDEERALLPDGDFFFFPANLWPHKNHERLFEALRRFRTRTGKSVELVLTGAPSGWEEISSRHGDLPIRHLGYVSPALVKLLYERAVALVFFSQYEGFGIPLLEAFEVGTPVVCSNSTSLPEVAGDAALMCDPTDIEAMSGLLEQIAGDDQLRADLVARGKERLPAYAWKAAADQLASGIERILDRVKSPTLSAHPLVSIVTPSYNQGRYIRRTIESVLAQTHPNVEYVVIDGGSTDETLDILRTYGDRVRWISEPDTGQTEAINKGLRMVSGEIVGYLNSDDVLLPHAIEVVVTHFHNHPECDLVYGDADYVDEEDTIIGTYATADYSFERLMDDCCVCQPAAYWRASVGAVVGPFDESAHYAMDYDYWIRVDRSGFVLQHLHDTIAQSRLHATTKTLSARPAVYREILDVCRRRGGYVSRRYVEGFWHHLAYERPRHPALLLRAAPSLRARLAAFHYRWLNRHLYSRSQWFAGGTRLAKRVILRRLHRTPRLLALLVRIKTRLQSLAVGPSALKIGATPTRREATGRARVRGYWSDNWIEERLEVVLDAREHDRQLRLTGRAVDTMTVEVAANGVVLGRFELGRGRQETVAVRLGPGPRETVSFFFSHSMLDTAGRPISFLLEETNLFREEDLAALV
jgi:glycosyltransferase involved in cell wall biosynthesis